MLSNLLTTSRTSPPACHPHAPLYREAFRLAEDLHRRWHDHPGVLPRQACETSLRLLESITLATWEDAPGCDLDDADRLLVRLRQQLRLASALALLDGPAWEALSRRTDSVGRQIGGWRRADPR